MKEIRSDNYYPHLSGARISMVGINRQVVYGVPVSGPSVYTCISCHFVAHPQVPGGI